MEYCGSHHLISFAASVPASLFLQDFPSFPLSFKQFEAVLDQQYD